MKQLNLTRHPVVFLQPVPSSADTLKDKSFPLRFKSRPLTEDITSSNSVPTTTLRKTLLRIVSKSI